MSSFRRMTGMGWRRLRQPAGKRTPGGDVDSGFRRKNRRWRRCLRQLAGVRTPGGDVGSGFRPKDGMGVMALLRLPDGPTPSPRRKPGSTSPARFGCLSGWPQCGVDALSLRVERRRGFRLSPERRGWWRKDGGWRCLWQLAGKRTPGGDVGFGFRRKDGGGGGFRRNDEGWRLSPE